MGSNLKKRPLVVTILAVIGFFLAALSFLVAVLLAVISYLATRTGGPFAGTLSSFTVPIYGFRVGFGGLAALEFVSSVYGFLQGYGLWKLKTWGWWLYIISLIVAYALTAFNFSSPSSDKRLIVVAVLAGLLQLWYFITRRDRFDVKLSFTRVK